MNFGIFDILLYMAKGWATVFVLFIIIILGLLVLLFAPTRTSAPSVTTTTTPTTATGSDTTSALSYTIVVAAPTVSGAVTSPLTITGKARGTWYFEGSAPAVLLDQNGSVIAHGHIQAQGDWMTTEFVPFTGTLIFDPQPVGSTGTLVLTNDNPSGDPTRQKTLDIPVKF
jgi:hypothetical protein